jgi:hypothetical protein
MEGRSAVRGFVLAGVMLMTVVPAGRASEREPPEQSEAGMAAIAGSWIETTSFPGGVPFSGLVTFGADGSLVSGYQGSVILAGPSAGTYGSGHGCWVRERGGTFSTISLQLVSGFDGTLLFVNTIKQRITVNKSRDAYESVVRAEFTDPSGNLLLVLEGMTEGRKINVQPLP